MSKLRSISTAFWSDPFIEELTAQEKLLFIYLITNEKTNMLGVYEMSVKKMSFETGIDKSKIVEILAHFEKLGKVRKVNDYIILVNFAKHQNYNPNMMKSAIDVYHNLPNFLKNSELVLDKTNPLKAFETLLKHLGMVRKIEVELEDENKGEKEGENKEENNEPFDFKKSFLALGVDKQILEDWLKVRTKKKATNSETSFKAFLREVEKAQVSIHYAVEKCAARSWITFEAKYVENDPDAKKSFFDTKQTENEIFRMCEFSHPLRGIDTGTYGTFLNLQRQTSNSYTFIKYLDDAK